MSELEEKTHKDLLWKYGEQLPFEFESYSSGVFIYIAKLPDGSYVRLMSEDLRSRQIRLPSRINLDPVETLKSLFEVGDIWAEFRIRPKGGFGSNGEDYAVIGGE